MTARWVDHFGVGLHASRPSASAVPTGAFYSCTTHGLIYQSDGVSSWSTWATLGGSGGSLTDADIAPVTPNDQTGTTYTFVLADGSRLVTGNNASAQTFTIPPNSSVAFPLGTTLQVYNKGAGLVSFAAGAGVTIRTPRGAKVAVQYGLAQAVQVATDVWAVAGDVTT